MPCGLPILRSILPESRKLYESLCGCPLHWVMAPYILHLLRVLWLPVASSFAGILNAIAGGGSFLSLPALLASTSAIGVGAVTAQATNTVALWPGQLTSMVAFRHHLREYGWKLLPLAVASGVGGEIGGWLLLHTGNRRFREQIGRANV